MQSITFHFDDKGDREALVDLLAQAIRKATGEPLAQLASAIRGDAVASHSPEMQPIAEPEAQLVDVDTVAAMLGVSSRMVRQLRDCGKLPKPVSLGRLIRWRRTEIVEWLEAGCPRIERRGISRR